MMKQLFLAAALFFSITVTNAQGLKNLIKKATTKDSTTGKSAIDNVLGGTTGSGSQLSTADVVSGLKEALTQGTTKGAEKLSAVDGFFKDAAIKILLPEEAQKVMTTVSKIPGGQKMVDDAILSMNRAAEDAAKSAAPIFVNAIKNMSINDAWGILKGGDSAATKYLRITTTTPLTAAFKPVIETSLQKVNATQYWNTLFTTYNKLPLVKKINPDLTGYVTDKALSGMFYQVAQQEAKIRKDPVAQTTDLLKKVFGKQ
jgi:hypothetical protein